MNAEEKRILRTLIEHPKGELSPADFVNGIAKRNERAVQNLKSKGYIDTTPHQHRDLHGNYYDINFYHVTHKGIMYFDPWYKKVLFVIKDDIRTVLVSVVTATVTTVVTIMITNMLSK